MILAQMLKDTIEDIRETASLLFSKGWAEKNAGNISVNVSEFIDFSLIDLQPDSVAELKSPFEFIKKKYFLLTASNSRMRDIAKNPSDWLCLVYINEDNQAESFTLNPSIKLHPSSESASHLLLHEMLLRNKRREKSVIHTHPDELIAISHLKDFKSSEKMTRLLWSMHPETIIFLPEGIGFVPYTITGSEKLAEESLKVLSQYRAAIWEKHGAVSLGEKPSDAFDLLDTVSKSARIFFTCKSAGFEPEGLSEEQFIELKEKFGKI